MKFIDYVLKRGIAKQTIENLQRYDQIFSNTLYHIPTGKWGSISYRLGQKSGNLGVMEYFYNCVGIHAKAEKDSSITEALCHFNAIENSAESLDDMLNTTRQLRDAGHEVEYRIILNHNVVDGGAAVGHSLRTLALAYIDQQFKSYGITKQMRGISSTGFAILPDGNIEERSTLNENLIKFSCCLAQRGTIQGLPWLEKYKLQNASLANMAEIAGKGM